MPQSSPAIRGPRRWFAAPSFRLAMAASLLVAAFTASVTEMDREIAALQTIVAWRRGDLDAATVGILESSLKLIDRAISESRAAIALTQRSCSSAAASSAPSPGIASR